MSELPSAARVRACVVTPGPVGPTETFIDAHIRLPHVVEHLYGPLSDLRRDGKPLRDHLEQRASSPFSSLLNVLPRFVEYRLRKRWFPPVSDSELCARFFRQQQIDVVLAEYGTAGAAIVPACSAAGIPLVVHFHGFDATRHDVIEEYRERYAEMFRYASSVIVVSRQMCQDLVALGCPAEKLVVSHCGPHPEFFRVTPDYRSDQVLMVGRLTDKKAPHISLLAFRRALDSCPGLKLTIIGAGELEGVCRDLVRVLSLQESVTFAGPLPPEQVREAMGRSFLFIQHSVRALSGDCEGTPVALLEAGAAGLPIVATRHAGIPDVFGPDSGGILVGEKDLSAMAEAMVVLAKDRGKAQAFGLANRQWIGENFSQEKHLATVGECLVVACAGKGKQP